MAHDLQSFTCLDPACNITAEFALDDEPERCSCGAAYDEEQCINELTEAMQLAADTADALAEDAAQAKAELRRERA